MTSCPSLVDLIFTGNGNEGSLNFITPACEISDETGNAPSVTFNIAR